MGDRDIPIRQWVDYRNGLNRPLRQTLNEALSSLAGLMHSISPPPRELRKLSAFPAQNIVQSAPKGIERFAGNLKRICKDGYAVPAKPGEKPATIHDEAFARGQHWHVPKCEDQSDVVLDDLEVAVLGGVILVTEQLPILGRRWYDALEELLALHEKSHYALAGRFLTGSGFNFLCLKDWRKLTLPPPLAFVPEEERAQTVGHYGAFWFNLGEAAVAESRLTGFIKAVNRYLGVKGGRVQSAVRRTLLKVLEAPSKKNRD
jgi:hypothetical protein